jgi:hypothetical protein
MSNTATIYLPLNTYVSVACYTNALFNQRVTITLEGKPPTVLIGSGEHNTPMPNGAFAITTPGVSINPLGYMVTVAVDSSRPNGQWLPSEVSQGLCPVMYYRLALVVSEDYKDDDWNDAVVQFSWWIAPAKRNEERAARLSRG